jgi:hypothetical protein
MLLICYEMMTIIPKAIYVAALAAETAAPVTME